MPAGFILKTTPGSQRTAGGGAAIEVAVLRLQESGNRGHCRPVPVKEWTAATTPAGQ